MKCMSMRTTAVFGDKPIGLSPNTAVVRMHIEKELKSAL